MQNRTATFIGHRCCPGLNKSLLSYTIEVLLKTGYTRFLCGGIGDFDVLCARILHELRPTFPHLRSHLVTYSRTANIPDPKLFDTIVFPAFLSGLAKTPAIIQRNRFLVEHSSLALCYVAHDKGGAAKTFQYAAKKNLPLINLANYKSK